jgi:hypothetical protein
MGKVRIALINIGHVPFLFDKKRILNWKSDIFTINNEQNIENPPESDVEDGFIDQKYDVDQIRKIVHCPSDSDFAFGLMANRYIDNYYLHRINNKVAVVSLYGMQDILMEKNISIEHFIIKQLYELSIVKQAYGEISVDDIPEPYHLGTRGCLFDINGDKHDVIFNTEKPIICESCKKFLKQKQIENGYIEKIERNLSRIKKPYILRLELFVRKYPLLSLLISAVIAIVLNLLANILWELIKVWI